MEKPFSIEKVDWSNVTHDYKRMQQISGLGAAAALIISLYMLLTTPLPLENAYNLWVTIILVTIFTTVYYLVPRIYLNKRLMFLPDLAFISAIASAMINFGEKGEAFIVFLIFTIAINAFMYPFSIFLVTVLGSLGALFIVHLVVMGNFVDALTHQTLFFQVYGVTSIAMILRVFAAETISLRKKEEGLQEKAKMLMSQKRELFLLIDNIDDGIIAVDPECKISLINKSAMKILGIVGSAKMMTGKDANKILTTVSTEGHVSAIKEAMEKRQTIFRDDLRLVRHDKTIRLSTNTAPIFDDQDNTIGSIVLFRDITAERKIEEQKAEFNAIASHELRTPLTVLEGYLYCLMTDKTLKFDRKTRDYIQKSHDASNQLLHLTNDILTVTKSEQNELKVALESVDIKKLIKEMVENFKAKAKAAKVKLVFESEKDIPKVVTDEGKTKEVITNLIENAIKFTEKGTVTVEIMAPKADEVTVKVTDTGIGITKEDQKMIFHKFYRSEDWQTRKRGGTGLGLFIAKSFIERLGGKIGVTSVRGKGSTFWFTLPTNGKQKKGNKEEELNEFIKSL